MMEHKNINAIMRQHSQPRQSGLGIVEVLVALVVVSVGVLGMASLQLTGMKHSSGGFNRSKALLYAQSMATRIRINEAGVDHYAAFDSSNGVTCNTPPVPYCQARKGVAVTPSCTPEEMATFDMFSVACGDVGSNGAEKGVVGTLPNGALTIAKDTAYQVTVSWSEGRSRTDSDELIMRRVQMRLKP